MDETSQKEVIMNKTLEERIKENRIVFITSNLDAEASSEIIFNLMEWSNESSKTEINIYLSSVTNNFIDAIAIYDVLCTIKNPINVFCIGQVGGFGTLFIAAATKGRRFALSHTMIRFDQPYGAIRNISNQQTEVEIEAKETSKQRQIFEEVLSERFSLSLEKIHKLVENNEEFPANLAKKEGFIDEILE